MPTTAVTSPFFPVALITGAGTGIGQALALEFARQGCECILVGRDFSRLNETEAQIRELLQNQKQSIPVHSISLSVSGWPTEADLESALRTVSQPIQRLKYLVLNAGIYKPSGTLQSSPQDWIDQFNTNLFGPVRLTQKLSPLLKLNQGAVLGISSTLGSKPTANTAAYSASKAGFNNWLQSLALELAPDVRVNILQPGIVDTPIHGFHNAKDKLKVLDSMAGLQPLARIGQPSDIAKMAWSLCGPGSEWTTGAVLSVDGGISLV